MSDLKQVLRDLLDAGGYSADEVLDQAACLVEEIEEESVRNLRAVGE